MRLEILKLVLCAGALFVLAGCANYAQDAMELRSACNTGDHGACIDYEALVKTCIAPYNVFQIVACEGVGPRNPYHSDGVAWAGASGQPSQIAQPSAPGGATVAPVSASAKQHQPPKPGYDSNGVYIGATVPDKFD